ncbi:MAG TPA: hypothetical protein VK707_10400 [Solirubrobacteraceae bacterium]|jgi:hypothetical protein|nr:hypothetical protein [Solirubrobacteraceae bacterium]
MTGLIADRAVQVLAASRRVLGAHRPFFVLLGIAVLLRVVTMALYSPAVLQWGDGTRYLRVSPTGFFGDPYSPAGYTAFLRAIHFFDSNLLVTMAIQNIVGLIGGTFVYLMVRRVSGRAWLGLLPAGIVFLSGDYIFLEHILMSETLFMTLAFASIYAALRALDDSHPKVWLAGSSVLMVASALVRPITLELPLVVGAWAFVALGPTLRQRIINALAAIVPGALLLTAYLVVASSIGPYTGINEMSGWDLYSRVAPFANCEKFTPPPSTRRLCETASPLKRNGPFYYSWITTSPGRSAFPLTPAGSKKPGEFARAAIEGQPLDYLKAVVKDMIRYVDPSIGTERLYSGIPYALYQFSYKTPGVQEAMEREIKHKGYSGVTVRSGGIPELEAYQTVFRVDGLLLLFIAILAPVGIVLERGRRRWAIVLLTGCSFLMFLLPVMTLSYDVRYGWPPTPLLAAAAALSGLSLFERRAQRSRAASAATTETAPTPEFARAPVASDPIEGCLRPAR